MEEGQGMRGGVRASPAFHKDLEAALAEPGWRGLPIGATLNDVVNIEMVLGLADWSPRAVAGMARRAVGYRLRGLTAERPPVLPPSGRYLLTLQGQTWRHVELVLPVIEALGVDRVTLMVPRTADLPLPEGTARVDWNPLFPFDHGAWAREYRRRAPAWRKAVRETLRRHRLPLRLAVRIEEALLVQTQRIDAWTGLLREIAPPAVLVEHDRAERSAPLVLAARREGVPSATLVHGAIGEYGYTPILADRILAWGAQQQRLLIAQGTPPERIALTGYQRLAPELAADRATALEAAQLPPDRPVALLATSPVDPAERIALAREFAAGVPDDVTPVIRVHPQEAATDYAEVTREFPRVRVVDNTVWSLDEALVAADVVVVQISSFGMDAVIRRRPTVVLDVLPVSATFPDEFERLGCPRTRSAAELREALTTVLAEPGALADRLEAASREICVALGPAAARNVAREVEALAAGRTKGPAPGPTPR